MLVLVSCSKSPSDSLYEHQSSCGRDARDWAAKKWHAPEGSLPDFANHYNTKLARCFVFWTMEIGGKPGSVTSELVAVNENTIIGRYWQAGNSEKPSRCEVDGNQCDSSKEWSALVSPYMHD
jgi:hypothetical protein